MIIFNIHSADINYHQKVKHEPLVFLKPRFCNTKLKFLNFGCKTNLNLICNVCKLGKGTFLFALIKTSRNFNGATLAKDEEMCQRETATNMAQYFLHFKENRDCVFMFNNIIIILFFLAAMEFHSNVVNSQPVTVTQYTVSAARSDWSTSVCDCCDDCGICTCFCEKISLCFIYSVK